MNDPNSSVGSNRIRRIREGGRRIELEDGSLWEVPDPRDRPKVEGWGESDVWLTRDRFGDADFILASREGETNTIAVTFVGDK